MAFNLPGIIGRNRPLRPTDATNNTTTWALTKAAEAHTGMGPFPTELPRTGSTVRLDVSSADATKRGMASLDETYQRQLDHQAKLETMRGSMDRRDYGRPSWSEVRGERKLTRQLGRFVDAAHENGPATYGVTNRVDFEGDPNKDPRIADITSKPGTGGKLGVKAYELGKKVGQKRKAKEVRKAAKNAPKNASNGMKRPPK